MKRLLLICSFFYLFIGFSQTYEVEEMRLVATIKTVEGINEKTDEFSPVFVDNRIYFTSSRQYNKNAIGESNWQKSGYFNVFEGQVLTTDEGLYVKDIRLMSNKIKSDNHTGPVCFTVTGDTVFFTQVVQATSGKTPMYNPQLFMAVNIKGKWKKIQKLPFSEKAYSFGHPSFDIENNRLYFASNKPGGRGQRDIYFVERTADGWSAPKGVDKINTANDEKFPFVIGGNIFFSSDREDGNGDMDIYYSAPEPADYPIKLQGLNSDYDDFGVSLLPNLSAGYFSSNRNGTDDIFYFTIERVVTVKNQLAGRFTFESLDAAYEDLTIQIVNENGEFVYEETVNHEGEFMFENVLLDSNFSVRLKSDGQSTDNMMLEFYNEAGEPTANFILDEEGSFRYKKLFYDYSGIVNFIPDDMIDTSSNSATLSGKLVYEEDPIKVYANSTVNLVNKEEEVIYSKQTDAKGNFEFQNLDVDEAYFIQVPECSDELILYVYQSEDIIYTQLKCNRDDYFLYRMLKPTNDYKLSYFETKEELEFMIGSSEITGRFQPIDPSKDPIQCKVNVYDEDGVLLSSTETDSEGNFRFSDLVSGDVTYQFSAESNEPLLLTLYNRYGDAVAKMEEEENHLFIFRPLGYKGDSNLSLMDDDIQFDLRFSEKYDAITVYFNTDQASVKSSDYDKLNKLYNLMKTFDDLKLSVSAYADATASNEYNFILSQKRADWIVNYLIKKGINKNRFTTNAYGETKLVDPEDDAVNRRAELRIYR